MFRGDKILGVLCLLSFTVVETTKIVQKQPEEPETIGGDCVIPLGSMRHNHYQWPLVYQSDGKLYQTVLDEAQILNVKVPAGAEALLSCGPNYLKHYNRKETLKVQCQGGKFSAISSGAGESAKALELFACDLRVIEEVLSDVEGCTNTQWTASAFGYVNPNDELTYILGEACYDEHVGKTIFAHVKLSSGEPASSFLQKQLPHNYLTTRRHPNARYKLQLFRGLHYDTLYERIRQTLQVKRAPFLHNSHFIDELLLPHSQFRAVQKLGWNYFVAHDELQTWTTLREDVRRLSATQPLDIYVGSHGVQTLRGPQGTQMTVYLQPAAGENGMFPIPALLWIVVKAQDKATAFGVYNDATENGVEALPVQHEALCQSKCSGVQWLSPTLKERATELVCCTVEEFRQKVQEVPAIASAPKMLN